MQEITAPIIAITFSITIRLRAPSVHSRHFWRVVPAIRCNRRGGDAPIGDQCSDTIASAVQHPSPTAPRTTPRSNRLVDALD